MSGKLPETTGKVLREWMNAQGVDSDTDVSDYAVLVLCDITSTGFIAAKRGKRSDVEQAQETVDAAQAFPKAFASAAGKATLARAEKTIRESITVAQIPTVIPANAIAALVKRHNGK